MWCALQDSYGFIWLGTSDGLNRYDGRGNKVYRNVLNEKFSLENNFVEALIEVDKNIWVGTNSGLFIFNVNSLNSRYLVYYQMRIVDMSCFCVVISRPLECAFTPNNQHINI